MVEFVTKHGHRFPVTEHGGNYYALTDGHGYRWITPSVHGNGYAISAQGITIVGTLRVKAGSSKTPAEEIKIELRTLDEYEDITRCMRQHLPIVHHCNKYRVMSTTSLGKSGPWFANVVPWIDRDA